VENVIPAGGKCPTFDMHCPTMSLPKAFKTLVETIPSHMPYLAADPKKVNDWRARMGSSDNKPKVGLVWTGNPRRFSLDLSAANTRRSLRPNSLAPLAELKNIHFYSLQKDGFELTTDIGLIDLMADCRDFSDTAALVANLDLVISVDTSVAHLAGAMGKPVWLLNRFDSCWRWLQNREESPWYPTMKIFRQTASGDWTDVVERIKTLLKTL